MKPVLVFDIGGVLIHFSHDPIRQFLIDNGAPVRSQQEFFEKTRLIDFECGKISCDHFVTSIRSLLGNLLTENEIISQWNGIFRPNDEMLELVMQLKREYRVFLLSNTNELHWKYLNRNYGLERYAHGAVLSFRVGTMKPDPRIYQYLCDEQGINPKDIIFLDDREENVNAAQDLGWTGIHHLSFEKTRQNLLDFDLKIPIRTDPLQ